MDSLFGALNTPLFGTPGWFWLTFALIIIGLLVLDLGVLHRNEHEIEMRESLLLYSGYFSVGVAFGGWIWWQLGATKALEFYTGFLVEQSLSMDNVFVMAMILGFFAIPRQYQHRVLFWGILGVVVLRAIMIGLGTALVQNVEWVLYLFGAFLLFTGVRMLSAQEEQHPDLSQNRLLQFLRKHIRVTEDMHEGRFLLRKPDRKTGKHRLHATPLLLALILIELADLVFAVDSVPAVLAISQDPFIVYTSNIFAILGLRSLYFALAALMHRFIYLKYALALVLMFIGGKIFLHDIVKVPALLSLSMTLGLLAGGVILSLLKTRDQRLQD
ncbi:TerC family protein [Pseudomonas sp. HMWF032]|uniref:TerC family protein n=1 Tax=Pseudomonas sp. HMWF032 TaxID=2056866 RepID=UPI000D3621FA|nr:TerC family protein [Pseudomonas sp. HMWF032]PTS86404.1 TerC family protein [Pseudomonas sp. HMWF032]PTT81407.1 TerC family protein [Pseudomonas sp. HMWF010]